MNKNAAAHTEILALVTKATEQWTGIDWDTGPQQVVALLKRDRAIDADNLDGCYWPDDGSATSQALNRRWSALLASDDSTEDRLVEARELAAAELAAVEADQASAAEQGRLAAEAVGAGEWDAAIEHAQKAASIERAYGDAPAWGGLEPAIKRLPEYAAAINAAEEYQDDQRSDDDILAYVDGAADLAAHPSLEPLINEAGSDAIGRTDANAAEWDSRYTFAWAREMREWCAL